MPLHELPHPLAGRRVRITDGRYEGALGELVDWDDRIAGRGWREHPLSDLAHAFSFRSTEERTPCDDEVVVVSLATGPVLFHVEQVIGADAPLTAAERSRWDDRSAIEARP